jgi:pimeloyl-ACP methyl ester carboxylesterase
MTQMTGLFPPGRLVPVPDVGEMFLRDSGPDTDRLGTVLLLHGWFATADINWVSCYWPLVQAGYRVLAVDHRGHGRGLRSTRRFRLSDCADDCAALLRELGMGQTLVVGYSMGGPIAQLMAFRYPELVKGAVLSATALAWSDRPTQRRLWRAMGILGFALRLFSTRLYMRSLRRMNVSSETVREWLLSELSRHDPAAMAEAGRELARFNSRAWVGQISVPVAVLCTTNDQLVPPENQREIQRAIPGAALIEVAGDHYAAGSHPEFVPGLLRALETVRTRAEAGETPIKVAGTAG